MEYVDKKTGKDRAHNLLKRFLDRCMKIAPYPSDLYEAMKDDIDQDSSVNPAHKTTYKLLLEWILEESHLTNDNLGIGEGHCCYCMRRIRAGEVHSTLEHVIPKSVNSEKEYNQYFSVDSDLEKDERIMALKEIFINRYHRQALPCPHVTAYENLVASCDGSLPKGGMGHKCCNGPRDSQFIPPLMFIPSISKQIRWKKNGGMVWADNPDIEKRERARIINEALCLNNEILKVIRMIWFYLSSNNMDCNLTAGQRRRVVDTLRARDSGIYREVIQNFMQDNYWDLLDDYRYFNDSTKFM